MTVEIKLTGPIKVRVDAASLPAGRARDLLDAMAREHESLAERYGFTHTGAMPGRNGCVSYGLTYPGVVLFTADPEGDYWPTTRAEWEALTAFSPPWPWHDDGRGMVIP